MDSISGVCPNCQEEGPLGGACPEKGCQRRGYHFIPEWALEGAGRLETEIGRLLDRRYLVVKKLGEGGFGRVFIALQQPLGMEVALKVLKRDADSEAHATRMRLFEREARAMARLQHPNIVKIVDFGFHEGAAYLVMELVRAARTLKDEVKARAVAGRELELDEVRSILDGVLSALEKAHAARIVHRDIKPENIMLQAEPGHPMLPRLLDFGLAKFVDADTRSSAVMGTPMYMAPEQLTKTDPGPWTDLYALGVVAYELMTGRRPFSGEVGEVLASKRDPRFDVLAAVDDLEIPAPIAAFLRRALAVDPQARFRSAAEFREGLHVAFAAAEGMSGDQLRTIDVSGLAGRTTSDVVGHRREATASSIPRETGRSVTPRRTLSEVPGAPDLRGPVDGGEARPREPEAVAEPAPATGRVDDWGSPAPPRRTRRWLVPAIAIAAAVGGAGGMALVGPSGGETGEPDAKKGVVATVHEADAGPAANTNVHEQDTTALTEQERELAAPMEAAETEGGRTPPGYVRIEPGSFEMGSPSTESGRSDDEGPQHQVRITRAYWLKSTEVTQGEWKAVMGNNPSQFTSCGDDCPVEQVSWEDAVKYLNKLSEREGLERCYESDGSFTGLRCTGYRLPTEAEWEYAARAGTTGARYGEVDAVAWYDGNSGSSTHPVGKKRPNAWGLYDMLGNVYEWVQDYWYRSYFSGAESDPTGLGSGDDRVNRGGSWVNFASDVRAARRFRKSPGRRYGFLGFRPARSLP